MSAAGAEPDSDPPHCTLIVGPECRSTRLALDPTAWMVLEELVLAGEMIGCSVVTTTSVRALGQSIGMSKDAVAAALRRLSRHGLVRREDQRAKSSGFFERSRYVVTLAGSGLITQLRRESETPSVPTVTPAAVPTSAPSSPTAGRRRRPASSVAHEGQLSLLDLGTDGRS